MYVTTMDDNETVAKSLFSQPPREESPDNTLYITDYLSEIKIDSTELNFNDNLTVQQTVCDRCQNCFSVTSNSVRTLEPQVIEEEADYSIQVDLDEYETTETIAQEISRAKERKDAKELKVLRAKERQLLIKEVERLRSKQQKPDKENQVEEKKVSTLNNTLKTKLKINLAKKRQILEQSGLSPTKTVTNLHSAVKPELLKLNDFVLSKTEGKQNTPRERMYGFTVEAYKVVKRNQLLSTIVNIANFNLYNLRNSVQLHHIDESLLTQVPQPRPQKELSHLSLMGLDMGDDAIEVIKHDDFIQQVLTDLGLKSLIKATKDVAQLDQFFAQIGALAVKKPTAKDYNDV